MVANAGMITVYNQAASVRSTTGVDPAIIAVIASTESDLSKAPFTLGITTAAVRGGAGISGLRLGSGSPFAGSSQPSSFWAYQNGAEAAIAFRHYIEAYQPALAPYLNDARQFFNPTGAILHSNYYVPTPPEAAKAGSALQATINYYTNWLNKALQFGGGTTDTSPSPITINPDTGQVTIPNQATVTAGAGPNDQGVKLFSTPFGNINIPTGLIAVLIGITMLIFGAILAFVSFEKPSVTVKTVKATV